MHLRFVAEVNVLKSQVHAVGHVVGCAWERLIFHDDFSEGDTER